MPIHMSWIPFLIRRSLCSHALRILDKSSQSLLVQVTDAQTKVKLKIPQLTLGDLAHMNRHWDENPKVLTTLPTLCITGKLDC